MTERNDFTYAEIDKKEEAKTILFQVRESFGEVFPLLLQEHYDELCENYAREDTEDVLMALGQEVTTDHLCLYLVDSDSDSYHLTVVPEENETSLRELLKRQKLKGKKLAQPRKRPGSKAKRIDLGKRMPCRFSPLPEEFTLNAQKMIEDKILLLKYPVNWSGAEEKIQSCLVDIEQESVQPCIVEKVVQRIAKGENCYGAILLNPEWNPREGLLDKNTYICIGSDLDRIEDWKIIYTEKEKNRWDTIFFNEDNLFLANRYEVAVIEQVKSAGKEPRILLKASGKELTFSKFFALRGELYVYFHRKIYCYEKEGFLKKADFNKVVYTITKETVEDIVTVSDEEVAFFSYPLSVPVTKEPLLQDLTILNVKTGKADIIPVPKGGLCYFENDWLGICYSSLNNVKKGQPILKCINLHTKEECQLPYGVLGNAGIREMYVTSSGKIVFLLDDNRLCYPEDLWEFMKKF